MDTTVFLSQLWGPVLLTISLGVFISRSYYIRLYRDLEKETLSILIFGMVAMVAGIAQIGIHNEWNTFSQILISILGWGLLLKGVMFIVIPKIVDKSGNWWVTKKCIPYAGICMLVLGIYLSWIGYF